jgi:hypothetical protein
MQMTATTPKHKQLTLREQVPVGAHAGLALIDTPQLEALDRLVAGPVRSIRGLQAAEVALRAILLHKTAMPLEEGFIRGAFFKEQPDLLVEGRLAENVQFSDEDPAIPAALRKDMNPFELSRRYLRNILPGGHDGDVAAAAIGPMDEPHVWLMGSTGSRRVETPALPDIFGESFRRMQRVLRLTIGYLGGAGVFSDDYPSKNHTTKGPWNTLPAMLEHLDAWYDPASIAMPGGVLQPYIPVPTFLAAVLRRATTRDAIPKAVVELRQQCTDGVNALHEALWGLHVSQTKAERGANAVQLQQEFERLKKLTSLPTTRNSMFVRGLALDSLDIIVGIFNGSALTTLAAKGAKVANAAAEHSASINRMITPSLADALYRMASSTSDLVPDELLAKHLSADELIAVRASLVNEEG